MTRSTTDKAKRSHLNAGTVGVVACAALALFGLSHALSLGLWSAFVPGSGLFPLLASILVLATAAAALVETIREPDTGEDAEPIDHPWRLVMYIIAMIAWAALFQRLGFLVSSGLALLVVLRFAEHVSWLWSIVGVAASLLVSWLLFDQVLGVPMPPGILGR